MPVQGAAQGADRAAHLISFLFLFFLQATFFHHRFSTFFFLVSLSLSCFFLSLFLYLLDAAIFDGAAPRGLAPGAAERSFILEAEAAAEAPAPFAVAVTADAA